MKVFAIWEPILPWDRRRPGSGDLGRLSDQRVRHFWDTQHLLAKKMSEDARDPQPKQQCCERSGTLWDLAAVYPRGAVWTQALPAAIFFDGPVVRVRSGIESAILDQKIPQPAASRLEPSRIASTHKIMATSALFRSPRRVAE